MRISEIIIEDAESNDIISLWHGGRGLEHSFSEIVPNAKGRWEHGPGLYLTTSYNRASSYAKGSRKVYKVSFRKGTDIRKVKIPIEDVLDFAKKYVVGRKREEFLDYIRSNMERMGSETEVDANVFLNLLVNDEAIASSKTPILVKFLVDHGIDYSIVRNYGGSGETVVVLFNRAKIVKVEVYSARKIDPNEFDIQFMHEAVLDPEGWGTTEYNTNVDYLGLKVQMAPSTFLMLSHPLGSSETNSEVEKHMAAGGKIAHPFLEIKIPPEWDEGNFQSPVKVVGHEGRNRMTQWIKLHGDNPIQVNLIPRGGLRRRDLSDDWIKELSHGIVSQDGHLVVRPFDPDSAS